MHCKQFLTLGCAVGIIAMGACFRNDTAYRPPPPPLRPMPNIKAIRIVVTNTSKTQHLGASDLALAIAAQLRSNTRFVPITIATPGELAQTDALLKVSIFNEYLANVPPPEWGCEIEFDATLTTAEGLVIWNRPRGPETSYFRNREFKNEGELWQSSSTQGAILQRLPARLSTSSITRNDRICPFRHLR